MGKLYNLSRMTTATTGTGTITLGSAVAGFKSFAAAGCADGDTITYAIEDGANSEIGRGVYTSSGTTLTRTVLRSTNSDAAISLSGSAQVFITPAAEDFQALTLGLSSANLALNGAMQVSIENGTSSTSVSSGTDKYIVDQMVLGHTSDATVVGQQLTATPTPPAGFTYCLQMKATTADASLASGQYFYFRQPIEGLRCTALNFGSSTAKSITVGFWVYATATGTGTVAVRNSAANRSYVVNFTVNASATWELKTVTITGDTSGTWLSTNGVGMDVILCFGSGSTYHGTNATWNASNSFATSSTSNFFGTNNNVVAITGLFVIPGTEVVEKELAWLYQRSYASEQRELERYYRQIIPSGAGVGGSSTNAQFSISHPGMRTTPSVSATGTLVITNVTTTDFTQSSGSVTITTNSSEWGLYVCANFTGLSTSGLYLFRQDTNKIALNARMT